MLVQLNGSDVCSTLAMGTRSVQPPMWSQLPKYGRRFGDDWNEQAFVIATFRDGAGAPSQSFTQMTMSRIAKGAVMIRDVSSQRGALHSPAESFHWACDDMEGNRAAGRTGSNDVAAAAVLSEHVDWWTERGYPIVRPPHPFRSVDEFFPEENMYDVSAWLAQKPNEPLFHDVEFTAVRSTESSSQPLLAHRLILATRVPYFRLMLSSGLRESVGPVARVCLDAAVEDIALVLRFIYGGCRGLAAPLLPPPDTDAERLLGVLDLAELMGLAFLATDCAIRLTALSVATLQFAFRVLPSSLVATEARLLLRKFYTIWLAVRWDRVHTDARFRELPPPLQTEIEVAASSLVGHRRAVSLKTVRFEDSDHDDDVSSPQREIQVKAADSRTV